jgi:hypothetical protein
MLHIALPVLDDLDGVIQLLDDLEGQVTPYQLWICVNQPESWWQDPVLMKRAQRNQDMRNCLHRWNAPNLHILDHSSPGCGWPAGKGGIGWARKVLIDAIMAVAPPRDWIISVDADTRVSPNYLTAVHTLQSTKWRAAVIPYWHRESDNKETSIAGSLYEIYLRIYRLQLIAAGAQFHITPLGSAFAVEVGVCQKISGLTPKAAGEDFYFLQKIAKYTAIKDTVDTVVYPQMRRSDRVIFGTGPAITDIEAGRLADYPLYPNILWSDVRNTIADFPKLWERNQPTPMSQWLEKQLKTEDLWTPLRQTFKTQDRFINACHQRVDALRIFQYLRQRWETWEGERRLPLREVLPETALKSIDSDFQHQHPSGLSLGDLRRLRLQLFDCEQAASLFDSDRKYLPITGNKDD